MVIVMCDEVGRGPFFGCVYAGSVIWDEDKPVEPPFVVKSWDSKKISPKKRKILSEYIKDNSVAWAIGRASPEEIDKYNIMKATMMAFHRALDKIDVPFDEIYVDGNRFETYCGKDDFIPHKCFVKGDDTHVCIGMASIIAKVAHDEYIEELCAENPELDEKYKLRSNMGYGTKHHIEGILKHGFTEHHRKSFKVKQIPNSYYRCF
tara:strand:- start:468 stop:1085 length:618 start_codon:yes stop_codon:yes gene_type:complete